MSAFKSELIAAGAAAVAAEIAFYGLFSTFGHIGGHGPDAVGAIALLFHLPGVKIADSLQLTGAQDTIFISITGALQFFLIFWLIIVVWRRRQGKREA